MSSRCRSANSCAPPLRLLMPTSTSASSWCGRWASISPAAARSVVSSKPPPSMCRALAWNIAAPARCRKPVIAASRGYCFGVGFELALACDFRVVSETSLYALPEQRLGQIPGSGGAARLQKMVGITGAKDIVMRSRRLGGRQAYEWGVATECVADGELEAATDALVEELRSLPALAQRTAKKLLNDSEEATLSLAIELEGQAYSRLRSSDDFREGVEAFPLLYRSSATLVHLSGTLVLYTAASNRSAVLNASSQHRAYSSAASTAASASASSRRG